MGQTHSSGSARETGQSHTRRCYYEVLGIELDASDGDIKKAYHRKALELHPDRNYGHAEDATRLFAEVQSAYEVLSDPQERAWYDSHREALLRNDDETDDFHSERNIGVTTTEDITKMYMNFNGRFEFTDGPSGFFAIFRDVFAGLAKEEVLASERESADPIEYPQFGFSVDNHDGVRPFYSVWSNFSTRKSFSWRDVYRYMDAPDRRVRRAMEKENKRFRDEGIKEFNQAVRALVAFVKRRDPRYLLNVQSDDERQKMLREMSAAQGARSRAANLANLSSEPVPEWTRSYEQDDTDAVDEFYMSEEVEREQFECVVCDKVFKSEKQYEAHEKSKKHIKSSQRLLREIRKENSELGLTEDTTGPLQGRHPEKAPEKKGSTEIRTDVDSAQAVDGATSEELLKAVGSQIKETENGLESVYSAKPDPFVESSMSTDSSGPPTDDEYAPREGVERRVASLSKSHATEESVQIDSDTRLKPKMGKAKAKRAKKAAQSTEQIQDFTCASCQGTFTSKNRLFKHIKEEGHAVVSHDWSSAKMNKK